MSRTFSRLLASAVTALSNVQRPERAERNRLLVRELLTERHTIDTRKGPLTLVCTNRSEVHYAHHFFEREPNTLKWIDDFDTPCTFWDVGSNTGVYALYAALSDDVTVYAFEPVAANFAALYGNIHANSLDDRIKGLCIGFFDTSTLTELRMTNAEAGSAMHQFGDRARPGRSGHPAPLRQTALTFAMDDFRRHYRLDPPHYVKIDVDGAEEEILLGAEETLRGTDVRSALIELSSDDKAGNERILALMERYGFASRTAFLDEHNVVFRR